MRKTLLMSAVLAGIAFGANPSSGVSLNAEGIGHVLIYPYYTVNAGQQTLVSVVNSTDRAKMVKIHMREAYQSRDVLDFNFFLSEYDVWTASIFAMSDAGLGGDLAAITTSDRSCTAPETSTWTGVLPGRRPYQEFLNFAYVGSNTDTGPTSNARTREGHIEIIELADFAPGSAYALGVTHSSGVPRDCSAVQNVDGHDPAILAPSGGIFGAAAIVNVAQGTFIAYNADALDDFTETRLISDTMSLDELPMVNAALSQPFSVSAFVFDRGRPIESVYPLTPTNRGIDAVTAVFMADAILNEYNVESAAGANTDWVVTFPTKRFYVDPQYIGSGATAIPPFVFRFGQVSAGNGPGQSCIDAGILVFDREEGSPGDGSGFPPIVTQTRTSLCAAVNVVTFLSAGTTPQRSPVLGSTLMSNVRPYANAGWLRLDLDTVEQPHRMRTDTNGNVYHGLPVTGFEAVNYVNSNVTSGVLANYSGAFRHRTTRECTRTDATCVGETSRPH